MLMDKCTKETSFIKEESSWSVLEQVARQGAQKMLQLALENEVEEFIAKHSNLTDKNGKKVVTKNLIHACKGNSNRNRTFAR
jgi:hypothetical protein